MRRFFFIGFTILLVAACSKFTFDEANRRAEEQVGLGNFQDAARIYERLLEKYPKDERAVGVWLQLGDIYSESLGDVEKGLNVYQRCIEMQPSSEAARLAHERRTALFEKAGRWSGMVEEYTALLKYFPSHEDVSKYRVRLGEAYITGREFQQARTELRGFVEKTGIPADLRERALFDIGETYFLEGKPGKAVRFYYALVQETPKSKIAPEAELRIATCLEEMGYLGMAHKFAEDARKNYPNKDVVDARLKGMEKRGRPSSQKKSPNDKKATNDKTVTKDNPVIDKEARITE